MIVYEKYASILFVRSIFVWISSFVSVDRVDIILITSKIHYVWPAVCINERIQYTYKKLKVK